MLKTGILIILLIAIMGCNTKEYVPGYVPPDLNSDLNNVSPDVPPELNKVLPDVPPDLEEFREMKEMGINQDKYNEYKSMGVSKEKYFQYLEQKEMGITEAQYREYKELNISIREYSEFLKFREMKEKGLTEEEYMQLKFIELEKEQMLMFIEDYNLTEDEYKEYEKYFKDQPNGKSQFVEGIKIKKQIEQNEENYQKRAIHYNLSIEGYGFRITLIRAGYNNDDYMYGMYGPAYRADLKFEMIEEEQYLHLDRKNTQIFGKFEEELGPELENRFSFQEFEDALSLSDRRDFTPAYFKKNNTRYETLLFVNAREDIHVKKLKLADNYIFDLENRTASTEFIGTIPIY